MTLVRAMKITLTAICGKIKPVAKLISTGWSVAWYRSPRICPLRTPAEVIPLESDYILPCYLNRI